MTTISKIVTISMKGNAAEWTHYKALSLITNTFKILLNIIKNKMKSKVKNNIEDDLFDFRPGKVTRKVLLSLRILLRENLSIQKHLCGV